MNNTFYRFPPPTTFAQWAARVPDDFTIGGEGESLPHALQAATRAGRAGGAAAWPCTPAGRAPRTGVVQLPPDLAIALERLDEHCARSPAAHGWPSSHATHPGSSPELRDVLSAHGAALCLADRGSHPITPLWRTADWTLRAFPRGFGVTAPRATGRRRSPVGARACRDLWSDPTASTATYTSTTTPEAARSGTPIVFARLARDAGLPVSRVPPLAEAPVGQDRRTSRTTSSAGLSVR